MSKTIDGVLVAMTKGCGLSGSKIDKEMTREVEKDKDAGEGAGTWSNKLFPPKACGARNSFTNLRRHMGQMYTWHMENTYVFEDELWRILPNKRIAAYKQVVEIDGKAKTLELLETFLQDYPNLKDLARTPRPNGRGELYKESDYPDEATIRAKFHYEVDYRPIPNGSALNAELFQEQIDKLNQLHEQRLAESNITLVNRFLEPFKLLQEQLKDTKQRKLAPVLDRIREFAQIVPSLDLSGNSELLSLAQQIDLSFAEITPEVLKRDEDMAKYVGQTCESVVTALGKFGQMGQRRLEISPAPAPEPAAAVA